MLKHHQGLEPLSVFRPSSPHLAASPESTPTILLLYPYPVISANPHPQQEARHKHRKGQGQRSAPSYGENAQALVGVYTGHRNIVVSEGVSLDSKQRIPWLVGRQKDHKRKKKASFLIFDQEAL